MKTTSIEWGGRRDRVGRRGRVGERGCRREREEDCTRIGMREGERGVVA